MTHYMNPIQMHTQTMKLKHLLLLLALFSITGAWGQKVTSGGNNPPPTGGVTGTIDIKSVATVWYQHDQNLGKGWVEVSTPLLNKVKELNGPGSESGDMNATSLTAPSKSTIPRQP